MRSGRFRLKMEKTTPIPTQIPSTEIELRFFVNLDLVFAMVGEKVKNETVATFYDVYDVFDPNSSHFFNLPSGLKVNNAFKAKRKRSVKDFAKKWEIYNFDSFWSGNSPSR